VVWRLAWPTILSNLLFTTVGFMHIKIVAGLGTSAVAAVTTGHRIFFLIQAILMGLSVAATALISRSWGARDLDRAEVVTWTALLISLSLAALLGLPSIVAPYPVAALFGLDENTTAQAAGFVFWLGVFSVASAANLMLSSALRATGDVITPLAFLFCSSSLNVLFAWLLAYGIGPLPQLGVAGVGLGGGFAGFLVTVAFFIYWWRGRFMIRALKSATLDRSAARQLIVIGMPAMLEQGVVQIAFLLFFSIVARYGTDAYAAYGIGISLVSFSIVVGFGFGIATATLVGQQLGAGRPEQAVALGWKALRLAVGVMFLLSLLLAWFAPELASFMIDDPDVEQLTVVFIYMIAAVQPIMAGEFVLGGALRGAGDTRSPLMATLCGMILGRLLPALLLSAIGASVYWIFAVMLVDYTIKSLFLLFRFRSRHWLITLQHPAAASPARELTVDSPKKNT
jgi:putative MATE family efflux protein